MNCTLCERLSYVHRDCSFSPEEALRRIESVAASCELQLKGLVCGPVYDQRLDLGLDTGAPIVSQVSSVPVKEE